MSCDLVKELRAASLEWLRFERRCAIVMHERCLHYHIGRPDCIGVLPNGRVVEVEIKVTAADFRANCQKEIEKRREANRAKRPYQFYFAMPQSLADDLASEIPEHAGLLYLSPHRGRTRGVRELERMKPAKRFDQCLTIGHRDWIRLVSLQSNAIVSLAKAVARMEEA